MFDSLRRIPAYALVASILGTPLGTTAATAQTPEPIKFARLAGIANDGRVAFSYQDDIWTVDADGSNPRRVTAHVARDFSPRFSPDGKWMTFTSNRNGNNDVYIVPAAGGEPKQLTWFVGNDDALYWTPDGKGIVMASQRGTNAWGSPLYLQPIDGSLATPMGMGIARSGMISQDGAMIAFNRNLPSAWRKEYRGNAAATIAVMNVKNGDITELTNTDLKAFKSMTNNVFPMWGADGMIYFATEREGPYNLWRMSPRGGNPQQVTKHREGGVFFPSISPDGRRIVYQNDFDLYTIELPSGTPKKLTIAMAFDPKDNDISILPVQSRAEGFSISPAGDYMAVDYHGEIMIVPTESGIGERVQVTNSPWRDQAEEYAPDGRKIAYISDESGDQEIWVYDIGNGTRKKLSKHASEKSGITWSPNSQKIAFTGDNRIFEVDVAGGETRELTHNEAGGYILDQYSADGNWLLYSRSDVEQNSDVFLYDIKAKKEFNVTQSPWNERNAALTADGRTVVFSSNRDGETTQLYAVTLAKATEDPTTRWFASVNVVLPRPVPADAADARAALELTTPLRYRTSASNPTSTTLNAAPFRSPAAQSVSMVSFSCLAMGERCSTLLAAAAEVAGAGEPQAPMRRKTVCTPSPLKVAIGAELQGVRLPACNPRPTVAPSISAGLPTPAPPVDAAMRRPLLAPPSNGSRWAQARRPQAQRQPVVAEREKRSTLHST